MICSGVSFKLHQPTASLTASHPGFVEIMEDCVLNTEGIEIFNPFTNRARYQPGF